MRLICLYITCTLLSCSTTRIGDFKKIKDYSRQELIDKIIPDREYDYWEYRLKGYQEDVLVRNFGDGTQKHKMIDTAPETGFFFECEPGICYSYISYIIGQERGQITNEDELVHFLGDIDNLEEAILLSKINGLWFDKTIEIGGSYRVRKNGYELNMMKWVRCPETKESFKVTIEKSGYYTATSRGVYYESGNCYSH